MLRLQYLKSLKISGIITILLSLLFSVLLFYVIDKKIKYSKINDVEKLTELELSIDSTLSLGEIPNKKEKTFSFYIRNKGVNKLYISDIDASCGCSFIKPNKNTATARDSIAVLVKIKPNSNNEKNILLLNFSANTKAKKHQIRIIYSINTKGS